MEIREILEKGDEMIKAGHGDEAMEYYEKCLDTAAKEQDWIVEYGILNELLGMYRDRSMFDKARAAAIGAVEILGYTNLADSMPAATTYLNVANLYRAEGKLAKALEVYLDVEAMYQKQDMADYYCLAGLYNNLSVVNIELGNCSGGMLYGERAVEFLKMIPGTDGEIATVYNNLAGAMIKMEKPNHDLARKYIQNAEEAFAKAASENPGYFSLLVNKAYLAQTEGDTESARTLYAQAMELVKKHFGENKDYKRLQDEYNKL